VELAASAARLLTSWLSWHARFGRGRNLERGEKTVAEIGAAGGRADFISSDLRDRTSARDVAKRAVELGNRHVDILINNAGIYPFGPTHEMTKSCSTASIRLT